MRHRTRAHSFPLRRADVGRVTDDEIVGAVGRSVLQNVQLSELHGKLQAGGVLAGNFQGRLRNVNATDVPARAAGLQRQGDAAGTRADVQYPQRAVAAVFLQDPLHEFLGLGAGDEDGGGNGELQTVEIGDASDVLDRLAGLETIDGRPGQDFLVLTELPGPAAGAGAENVFQDEAADRGRFALPQRGFELIDQVLG